MRRTRTRPRSTTSRFAAVHVSILMTGCWPALAEAARPGLRAGRARRGRGLSRTVRELLVVVLGARRWRGCAAVFAVGCGGGGATTPRPSVRRRLASSGQRSTAAAAGASSTRYVDRRRARVAARPGRRHGRRGPGVRHADRRRDRRRGALRLDLGLDQGQHPAPRRADLVPLEGRQGGGPGGGLRRRRGRRPARCWSPRAASSSPALRSEALDLGKAILDDETAALPGRAGAGRRARGRARRRSRSTRATSRPPPSRPSATRRATAAGAACRRARARSPTC